MKTYNSIATLFKSNVVAEHKSRTAAEADKIVSSAFANAYDQSFVTNESIPKSLLRFFPSLVNRCIINNTKFHEFKNIIFELAGDPSRKSPRNRELREFGLNFMILGMFLFFIALCAGLVNKYVPDSNEVIKMGALVVLTLGAI